MERLFTDQTFAWAMLIFFIIMAYVTISILEYVRGAHHRRLGYWFSKTNRHGGKRMLTCPVSLKGHLFLAISIVLGAGVVVFIDDIRVEFVLLIIWVLVSYIVTHRNSAK